LNATPGQPGPGTYVGCLQLGPFLGQAQRPPLQGVKGGQSQGVRSSGEGSVGETAGGEQRVGGGHNDPLQLVAPPARQLILKFFFFVFVKKYFNSPIKVQKVNR